MLRRARGSIAINNIYLGVNPAENVIFTSINSIAYRTCHDRYSGDFISYFWELEMPCDPNQLPSTQYETVPEYCINRFCTALEPSYCASPRQAFLEVVNESGFYNVYPTVSNNLINISNLRIKDQIKVINILGEVVFKITVKYENENIEVSNYSDGLYLIMVNDSLAGKFIKN